MSIIGPVQSRYREAVQYITLLHYIKSYLECPKSLRTARTLYEIKGSSDVEVQLCGKTFGEKISF